MNYAQYLFAITAISLTGCGNSPQHVQTADHGLPPPISSSPKTPSLKVQGIAVPEGNTGDTRTARFKVSLLPATASMVTVNYATQTGSADTSDFNHASGTLVFAPHQTEQTIDVSVLGDNDDEGKEQFTLQLSNATGATLLNTQATGTIANDDQSCNIPAPGSPNPWLENNRKLINFSHRGGADDYPENTLYSYKKSVELGADVLEMDVYENADGELMVIHDATVDRTTNSTGDVSNFTTAELKAMDAAYWFVANRGVQTDASAADYIFRGIATGDRPAPAGYDANDFSIPTLREILAAFPDELINIELKPDPDSTASYAGKVATLVLEFGRADDVVVASFIDEPAAEFKAQAPCVSTSFPTGQAATAVSQSKSTGIILNPAGHHAFQVPPSLGVEVVNQKFVDDAHAANIAVHVWTINSCDEMVRLLNLGVDAIMTDRPLMLEQLLQQTPGAWSCDSVVWPQ